MICAFGSAETHTRTGVGRVTLPYSNTTSSAQHVRITDAPEHNRLRPGVWTMTQPQHLDGDGIDYQAGDKDALVCLAFQRGCGSLRPEPGG